MSEGEGHDEEAGRNAAPSLLLVEQSQQAACGPLAASSSCRPIPLLLLRVLSLAGGDGYHVVDVVDGAAA
jgi:hypothetical protein